MSRIRAIKPGFFKDSELYDAEKASGLPLRIAYAGLWTVADREGRFKWLPREIKTDVLPYDDVSMEDVLNALAKYGFVFKYKCNGCDYGFIPKFAEHQHVNKNEAPSTLPEPPKTVNARAKKAAAPSKNINARASTTSVPEQHHEEGNRKGREQEGKGTETSAQPLAADTLEASPAVISIPTNLQDEEFPLLESHVREFERTYPGVDIRQQLREMRMWAIANPRQRKTASGMMRFVNSWLSKAQNRSGAKPVAHEPKEHKPRLGSEGIHELIEARRRGEILPHTGATNRIGEG